MINRRLFALLLGVSTLAAAPVDLDRAMILLPPPGAAAEDQQIAIWQHRVQSAEPKASDYERLGWAFVAKARRTLDNGYYKLAEKTADVMDRKYGATPEAALLRGHTFHNLHRFHEAERIGRSLATTRGMPEDWALLSDALMEEGDLSGAIDALQRFANLKPGPEANARIAHIRWLKGDLSGAITAMGDAVRQTSPSDAVILAWMSSRLSGYELQAARFAAADALARRARELVPDYPPALLALGKVSMARNAPAAALPLLQRAAALNPLPEYLWWLADAYRMSGNAGNAAKVEARILDEGATEDPRTFALFLATRHERSEWAVKLARAELDTRGDIQTHDALAWALYAHGEIAAAAAESQRALASGSVDARLLLHAGLIAHASGDDAAARRYLRRCAEDIATLLPSERDLLGPVASKLAQAAVPTARGVAPTGT